MFDGTRPLLRLAVEGTEKLVEDEQLVSVEHQSARLA
jgi:hypothetical protein